MTALAVGLVVGTACGSTESREPRLASAGGDAGTCAACGGGDSGGAGQGGESTLAGTGGPLGASAGKGGDDTGSGQAGEAGAAATPQPEPDLELSAISVLQTIEVPLMKAGVEIAPSERVLPVIAGKPSLFRASVELGPTFAARKLLGVLDLKGGGRTRTLVSELNVAADSRADDLATSFTFVIEPSDLMPTSSYRLRVLEADTRPITSFPPVGYLDLQAAPMQPFEVVLVPFIANGFSPLVGVEQVEALRQRLRALYPLSDVELSVAPAVKLGYVVNGDGDGWDPALNQIYDLRSAAAPADNVFYYGMLAPDESYSSYCVNGCILGYSNVADPDDVDSRGSIGVTVFPDGSGQEDAWNTVAHELGHALGRDHAPCDVDPDDTDPEWPDDPLHRNGAIAVYGYDFAISQLLRPRAYRDVMGYCSPVWVSDYTYAGLFERLTHVQAKGFRALGLQQPELFRLARVERTGKSSWLGDRYKRGRATHRLVSVLDQQGRPLGTVNAQVARVDHGPGAFVWLPLAELNRSGAAFVDLGPWGGAPLAL